MTAIAVGAGGTILTSPSLGESWTLRTSGTANPLYGVALRGDGHAVAVGNSGTVLTSADYGATWSLSSQTWHFRAVAMDDAGHVIIVAMGGRIYTSSNFGGTWTERTSGTTDDFVGVAMNASGAAVAITTQNGKAYVSSNFGQTWAARTITALYPQSGYAAAIDSAGKIAVSGGSYVASSQNSGTTWDVAFDNNNSTPSYNCIAILDDRRGVTSGSDTQYSADGFQTLASAGKTKITGIGTVKGVAYLDDGTILAVGLTGSAVQLSLDDGVTWTSYATGNSASLNAVALVVAEAAPYPPTLIAPAGNQVIDLTQDREFAWSNNPGNASPQSAITSCDLRYRIIGGAWTEIDGTTTATSHTVAAGTLAAGSYEWQVRSHSQTLTGGWSTSEYFTAASAPPAPVFTDPADGSTIGVTSTTVAWTSTGQARYQMRVVADDGAGQPDTAAVMFDTGSVTSTVQTRVLQLPWNTLTVHLQLRYTDSSGLWSAWDSVKITVSWIGPPKPSLVLTARDDTASILIEIINPEPAPGDPDTASNAIYLAVGDAPETRVAVGIPKNGQWIYWTPPSGVEVTARVVATADDTGIGTTSDPTP